MIKFALRRNLIYPLQLLIYNLLRKLEVMLLDYLFNFGDSIAFTPFMFIGEFLVGLLVYKYQRNFTKKKKIKYKFFSIELIERENKINRPDSIIKIYILIFFVSFFDWVQFTIWNSNVPKFRYLSSSLVSRMSVVATIGSALFYYYILRLSLFKHQIFSIIIISIYFVIIITTEFFFQEINIFLPRTKFILALLLAFFCQIFATLVDSIEKYLYEYNFLNPYFTLMLEGFFGFFISFLHFFQSDYLQDFFHIFKTSSAGNIVLFIFLMIVYIVLCAGRNLYRVITTKLYSPMARTLTDYILNPIYMSVYFALKKDFLRNGERNVAYFVVNLILSIIISFIGCVYDEFIVLFFCGLDHNTHAQVSKRAFFQNELDNIYSDKDDNDD